MSGDKILFKMQFKKPAIFKNIKRPFRFNYSIIKIFSFKKQHFK
jgi:hypothetical protein